MIKKYETDIELHIVDTENGLRVVLCNVLTEEEGVPPAYGDIWLSRPNQPFTDTQDAETFADNWHEDKFGHTRLKVED